MKDKKAQGLGGLAGAAVTFVVVAIVIVIGLDLTNDLQAESACPTGFGYVQNETHPGGLCCDSTQLGLGNCSDAGHHSAFTSTGNVTNDGNTALGALSSRMDLLATAVVLGVIIVVLLRVFGAFR